MIFGFRAFFTLQDVGPKRKQNVSAMERGQQTNCQRTNLKPNPVEFAPGHSKCLALVRFGPKMRKMTKLRQTLQI